MKFLSPLVLLFVSFLLINTVLAQNESSNEQKYRALIPKAKNPIKIDGLLSESDWQETGLISNFQQSFPFDTSLALSKTEVKILFDEKFIYVSAVCFEPKNYTVQTLRRDYKDGSSDLFLVTIDPFRDNLNGFYFAVNPYNVQKEGLIFNGAELNIDWDNKWLSAVKNYDDRYVVEIAIPFKTLRYKRSDFEKNWNINFVRNDLYRNERSSWAPIPRNFRMINQSFSGTLEWSEPPPKPGANVSLIPFVITEINKDDINKTKSTKVNAGFDAKIAITASLNLDLTVNPDFSQVEVDQQITDLSRFELFFPERRQFFIENSDLFNGFGSSNSNPFFSRRIGITKNTATGLAEKIPILGGVRLSGRLNKNWRIGFLNMQTSSYKSDSLPASNFTVATFQRRVFKRSNLAVILVNKENFLTQKTSSQINQYNRVAGFDFNMASANGRWQGKTYYHLSLQPNQPKNAFSTGAIVTYFKPELSFLSNWYAIGKGYNAEVGFVPRTGFYRSASTITKNIFPKAGLSKFINYWFWGFDYDVIYSTIDNRFTDWDANLLFGIRFQNLSQLQMHVLRRDYTFLFADFDPTKKYEDGFEVLKKGSNYYYNSSRIVFNSNFRKKFYYNTQVRWGQYYNGTIRSIQSDINFRIQPWAIIQFSANYSRIRLPLGFNKADYWIIGPRTDITFSRSLYWTTFIQYNNQIHNININSRLQWRFKPMSDLYIVFTNNRFSESMDQYNGLQQKNNALVVKLNFWL